MLTVAIIADVHANLAALDAVIADFEGRVDAVWNLGDNVGRGPDPVATVRRLRALHTALPEQHQRAWLAGNHDWLVLDRISTARLGDTLNSGVAGYQRLAIDLALWTRRKLNPFRELKAWLGALHPYHDFVAPGVYMAHGAYRFAGEDEVGDEAGVSLDSAVGEYTLFPAQAEGQICGLRERRPALRLLLNGHTHVSRLMRWDAASGAVVSIDHDAGQTYCFENLLAEPVYINPGSVGFPGKHDPCPTYVILHADDHFDTIEVEFRRVPYDWHSTVERLPRDIVGIEALVSEIQRGRLPDAKLP